MKTINRYLLILLLPFILFLSACKEESTTQPTPTPVNEAQVLAEYLESTAGGDFLNTAAPAMITAEEVRTYQLTNPSKIHIIDIRSATDFAKGRIEGAVNVQVKDIANYMKTITPSNYDKIAIVCYSGQTGGYATSLLRLLGYSNVYDMKFGMSAWNDSVENKWKTNIGNNYPLTDKTVYAKNAAGDLPTLNTGKTTGREILEARVNTLLAAADPFGDIKIAWNTVTANLSNYYIINYWTLAQYNLGHMPGAVQYTPKADLKLSTFLKTLPTNKTIVLYCFTGQTSAQVATVLKLLGYDAKSLLYGASIMNYDLLVNNNLTRWQDSECKYYPYVK